MQGTQLSLKKDPEDHKGTSKVIKSHTEEHNPTVELVFAKNISSPTFLRKKPPYHASLLNENYMIAKDCISRITDPLWQKICSELINMLGPVSVLKIWKSKLGELSIQDRSFDITCETKETAIFVQQYDFVILGVLQQYFPSLKQLRVKII